MRDGGSTMRAPPQMLRFAVFAAAVVAALAAVKDEHVISRARLVGTCETVEAARDGGEWLACRRGSLLGYPDLSADGCTRAPTATSLQLWQCPAPLVVSRDDGGAPAP